ncbi:MAG: M12 family metallo-peptidase [Candidatus Kapabacteria bacterium]|nr:M12 family metallo-peptidase [Candidatus Kapabacteria bacterium]
MASTLTRVGVFFVSLIMFSSLLTAQKTVDARLMFSPINVGKNVPNAQVNSFVRSMMLQNELANTAFDSRDQRLNLSNFPMPGNESGTLVLERTRAVFDANTEFYTHTKAGKVAFKVRPIVSYRGTVDGDKSTQVSLHYSEGNLTGFVIGANGRRTVIGRDYSLHRTSDGTPHAIADEVTMFGVDPLSKFLCGQEELPVDQDAMARQMSVPSRLKGAEKTQAEYLREFKVAMVLREDIDSVMKLRGETDEEIAQYFMKIAACMAQPYQQELDALLYVGYFEKFTKDEPSGYVYDGREPGKLLQEFSRNWASVANNVDRTVAHLYALVRPVNGTFVGGIAYLGQLCNKKFQGGYGVSTMYLNASPLPGDPNRSNAFVWDVYVSAHEMGHNIGAYHTHSCYWSPPIDTCQLKSDGTDACYDLPSLRRVIPGTIMSYCHLVNGSSTPMTFGDRASERMRGWVAASQCTPLVTTPTIHITEPRGSDFFNVGDKMTIRWSSARVSAVNISWGGSDRGPWTDIVSNVNAADRQYVWTMPVISASPFWIRVSDASNESVRDTSIASYRINIPVVLDAPKGGERIGGGSAFTVRWTKGAGVGNVKVEFAPDGATFETLVASSAATSFAWTVPVITTENARIRAFAINAPTAASTSGSFAIGVRRFALEIPVENGSLCKNQLNQYRWSADFIPTIRIQYSTDNGANWRNATQQSTIDAALWQVFSRNINMSGVPKGTKLKLRVIDAVTEEVLDTRSNLTMDSCDAPVSVSELAGEVPFTITSVSPNPASSFVRIGVSSSENLGAKVLLVTSDGREIELRSELMLNSGSSTVEIPIGDVAAGMYRLVIRVGAAQSSASITIVR